MRRDHADAFGRNLVARDHRMRDIARRRDHPVAARERLVEQVAGPETRGQPVGKRGDQEYRHAMDCGKRTAGRAGAVRVHDVDALGGDQLGQQPRIAADAQRIDRVVRHRQPFAAEGAQFADQRAAIAGHDGAGAGLQQGERDIHRGATGRVVAQRRHQLQDGGAGERTRLVAGDRTHRKALAFRHGLRRQGADTEIMNLARALMSEVSLTSLTIESPARTIAVRAREGKSNNTRPGLFWLGGFKSDMKGTKAVALDVWAEAQGRGCLRFDYSGHGESGGEFTEGCIGRWLEESLAVYLQFAKGPQVVIGSSMGGWLALLLAQALRQHKDAAPIAGMVLIAPAVDFTEELMWKQFSDTIKREIADKGVWLRPSDYAEGPYPITRALIEDGAGISYRRADRNRLSAHILQGAGPDAMAARGRAGIALARDDVVLT